MWLFPLLAALVSGTFAGLVLRSWTVRRGPHLAAWGLALAMFAVASIATAAGILFDWSPGLFRTYYLFGAILNVPVLALGTLYLLAPRKFAHICAVVVAVLAVGATIDVAQASLAVAALDTDGIPAGSEVLSEEIRTLSRVYSFSGFFVVAGGAAWSAVRLARQGGTHFRRLALANVLIAAGTTVVASASALARYGQGSLFAVGLLVGVSLMFLGFVRTRPKATAP
jgi:hypothetical protein